MVEFIQKVLFLQILQHGACLFYRIEIKKEKAALDNFPLFN